MMFLYRLPKQGDFDTIKPETVSRHDLCGNGNYKESELPCEFYLIRIHYDEVLGQIASYAGFKGEEKGIAQLQPITTDIEKKIIETYIRNKGYKGLILPIEAHSRDIETVKENQAPKRRGYTHSEETRTHSKETRRKQSLQNRIHGSIHPLIIYLLSVYGEASPEDIAQRINSSPVVVKTGIKISERAIDASMEDLSENSVLERMNRKYRINRKLPGGQKKIKNQKLKKLVEELFD